MFGAWLSNGGIDGKVTEAGSRGPKGLFVCTELVPSLPCASR